MTMQPVPGLVTPLGHGGYFGLVRRKHIHYMNLIMPLLPLSVLGSPRRPARTGQAARSDAAALYACPPTQEQAVATWCAAFLCLVRGLSWHLAGSAGAVAGAHQHQEAAGTAAAAQRRADDVAMQADSDADAAAGMHMSAA
jgi:hypothetical protein